MKPLSLPLFSLSVALCVTSAHAAETCSTPSPDTDPCPGNSQKCTRVDFDHDNNGWGNGDQNSPGNSGDHNNAENGPGNGNPGTPPKDASANNGWGNGDQTPPGNSGTNNNAENAADAATQKELLRIESEALAKKAATQAVTTPAVTAVTAPTVATPAVTAVTAPAVTTPAVATVATAVVVRRAK